MKRMKRLFVGILAVLLVFGAGTMNVSAAGGHHGQRGHHTRTYCNGVDGNTCKNAPDTGGCGYNRNVCGKRTACCENYADTDGDGVCDNCGASVCCPDYVDGNGDGVCDNCGASVCCPDYADDNGNGICDNCGASVRCSNYADTDGDGVCDNCGASICCPDYADSNGNGICDNCGASVRCSNYADTDGDGVCDNRNGVGKGYKGTVKGMARRSGCGRSCFSER